MLVWSLSLYNTIEFKVSFFYAKSRTCSFIVYKLYHLSINMQLLFSLFSSFCAKRGSMLSSPKTSCPVSSYLLLSFAVFYYFFYLLLSFSVFSIFCCFLLLFLSFAIYCCFFYLSLSFFIFFYFPTFTASFAPCICCFSSLPS